MKKKRRDTGFYESLGIKIRERRNLSGLSQEALAKLVGLNRTSLTNIEKGRQHPPVHILCDIAEQLKANISELLPSSAPINETVDVRTLASRQVRTENELAFIETAIKGGTAHGNTKK